MVIWKRDISYFIFLSYHILELVVLHSMSSLTVGGHKSFTGKLNVGISKISGSINVDGGSCYCTVEVIIIRSEIVLNVWSLRVMLLWEMATALCSQLF